MKKSSILLLSLLLFFYTPYIPYSHLEKNQKVVAKENYIHPFNGIYIGNKLKYKRIQKKYLSCELSIAADILSTLENKNITEDNVLDILDKSQFAETSKIVNGKVVWGNPNAGYVGYIDTLPSGLPARQRKMTGYGVLERPIAKVYNHYQYKTKIITETNYSKYYDEQDHLTEVLLALHQGNFVQLWGDFCTYPEYEDTHNKNVCFYGGEPTWNKPRNISWYYEENGEYILYKGLNGEHAFTLLGYKGNILSPTHIIVRDSDTGEHSYPIKEWMRKWNKMQNRSIIIKSK